MHLFSQRSCRFHCAPFIAFFFSGSLILYPQGLLSSLPSSHILVERFGYPSSVIMVQWKMGVAPIALTFQIQPFSTSMIMGERVKIMIWPVLWHHLFQSPSIVVKGWLLATEPWRGTFSLNLLGCYGNSQAWRFQKVPCAKLLLLISLTGMVIPPLMYEYKSHLI